MLVHLARLMDPVVTSVTVIGHAELHSHLGLPVIPTVAIADRQIDFMNGVVAALRHTGVELNLIIPCDMPFLTTEWLGYLVASAAASRADLVTKGFCSVYRKRSLSKVVRSIEAGIRSFGESMSWLEYETIKKADVLRFDPDGYLLWDIDTPQERSLVEDVLEKRRSRNIPGW